MIQKIVIISSIFFILFNASVKAQQNEIYEIENLGTEIFSFLNSLNDNINTFFKTEDKGRVRRHLGYLQTDLRKYLKERRELMDYLDQNNYKVDNDKTKKMVKNLKTKLDKLSDRLFRISIYIDSNFADDVQGIFSRIHQSQEEQSELYLTKLDWYLDGKTIDIKVLSKEGTRMYNNLQQSIELISTIKQRIKEG